mmetsp:Transcript_5339/g.11163  ORF Transcript_5339/g.11163 Transcript_5339/m.11163 type:complete len:274 (-) Transcript_5339:693-1514(-)
MPRCRVMASMATVWRVDSSRMSRGTRVIPNTSRRRMMSERRPSATSSKPVAMRDSYMIMSGWSRSSLDLMASESSHPSRARSAVTNSDAWDAAFLAESVPMCANSISQAFIVFTSLFLRCPTTLLYFSFVSYPSTIDAANSSISGLKELEMAISLYSSFMSLKNNLAARRRWCATTSLVTSGVTLGLPSRSPPIQEANRIGLADTGNFRPRDTRHCASNLRRYAGTASQRTDSITAFPPAASCWGVGLRRRISSDPHMAATMRRREVRATERS